MKILEVNKENFDDVVFSSGKTVLVDFYAEWCGPCKALTVVLDKLADTRSDDVLIAKVNIDDNPELTSKYQVVSVPTLMLVRNGNVVKTEPGFKSKEALEKFIND